MQVCQSTCWPLYQVLFEFARQHSQFAEIPARFKHVTADAHLDSWKLLKVVHCTALVNAASQLPTRGTFCRAFFTFNFLSAGTKHLVPQLTDLAINSCLNFTAFAHCSTLCSICSPPLSSQVITLLIFPHWRKVFPLHGNFTLPSISRLFANSLPHFQTGPICSSLSSPLDPYPRTKSCLTFITCFSVKPAFFLNKFAPIIFAAENYVTVKSTRAWAPLLTRHWKC